jgi:hypothetical protein
VERPADLGELEISVTPLRRLDSEAVDAFAAAGAHRIVVNVIGGKTPDAVEQRLRDAADLVQ